MQPESQPEGSVSFCVVLWIINTNLTNVHAFAENNINKQLLAGTCMAVYLLMWVCALLSTLWLWVNSRRFGVLLV